MADDVGPLPDEDVFSNGLIGGVFDLVEAFIPDYREIIERDFDGEAPDDYPLSAVMSMIDERVGDGYSPTFT